MSQGKLTPRLSVVVPARDAGQVLHATLRALRASDLPSDRWELVVVDDGSVDDTAIVAAEFADTIVRLPAPARGPAYARNRGAEVGRGEILVFVDADVTLHPEALRRFLDTLDACPEVGAVVGSFDDRSPGSLVEGYRSVVRHVYHQRGPGDVRAFWSACGAVRRDDFVSVGMFDEWRFRRAQVEDVELGSRLASIGRPIVLRPDIRATHLRQWRLGEMLATYFRDHAGPLARLLGVRALVLGGTVDARILNVGSALAAGFGTLSAFVALLGGGIPALAIASALWLLALGLDAALFRHLLARRGVSSAIAALPLHLMVCSVSFAGLMYGWALRHLIGDARPEPTTEAMAEVGVKVWPPVPTRR